MVTCIQCLWETSLIEGTYRSRMCAGVHAYELGKLVTLFLANGGACWFLCFGFTLVDCLHDRQVEVQSCQKSYNPTNGPTTSPTTGLQCDKCHICATFRRGNLLKGGGGIWVRYLSLNRCKRSIILNTSWVSKSQKRFGAGHFDRHINT